MNRAIQIPIAAQIVALQAAWAEQDSARCAAARAVAARRSVVLEQHVGLWLTELAIATRPLGMCDMRARHGTDGVSKSHLSRAGSVLVERGLAKIAHRGAKNAVFYVITPSGRAAVAGLDQTGAMQ